jgi:hypothetical protein
MIRRKHLQTPGASAPESISGGLLPTTDGRKWNPPPKRRGTSGVCYLLMTKRTNIIEVLYGSGLPPARKERSIFMSSNAVTVQSTAGAAGDMLVKRLSGSRHLVIDKQHCCAVRA